VAYSHRIFNSIEQVDLTEWQRVASACNGSIVMDPRFLAAVESSIKDARKFWYIILHDEGGAVGCTSACAITMDLADYADPGLVRIICHMPWLFSRLRHLKVLICGLPIGTGNHTLRLAQPSASPSILPFLDAIIHNLAIEVEADAIIYKEFGKGDLNWTGPLRALGYHPIATPPSHSFNVKFDDFAQYCAALRPPYRWKINRSRRKLSDAGLEIVVLSDPEEILRTYTPEVHALYHQTLARAIMRGEVIPIEFLHELTLRLNGLVELVAIRKDGRIVAFNWCLHAQSWYYMMYAGLDYQLNHQFDLYFNLMYAVLERGLQKRVSTIVFGISGDTFKARLGGSAEPLYVFVKGRGALISLILRAARSRLIARPAATTAPFNVFKNKGAGNSSEGEPTRTA
jgi:predicted N-acyltransferase